MVENRDLDCKMSWRSSLGNNLAHIRFVLGDANESGSQGLRSFLRNNYSTLKVMNPHFPLLIRESENTTSRIVTQVFGRNNETKIIVDGMDTAQIEAKLKKLVLEAGHFP